jgi:hypothetical protein
MGYLYGWILRKALRFPKVQSSRFGPILNGRTTPYASLGLPRVDRQHRRLRVSFSAPAETAQEGWPTASVSANVAELSLYGCYMATATPYEVQTLLRVKIFNAGEYFEAKATVIYSQPAKGMGLAFRETKPHFLTILKQWILEALKDHRNLQ